MRFEILTLFPEFFASPLRQSIIGRAIERGVVEVAARNIRDYAADKHRTTDDYPYGGGAGMVMKVEPVVSALESLGPCTAGGGRRKTLLTTPQGAPFTQGMAASLSALDEVVIVCGRYEGFDERIRAFVDMEVSAGDYVLTGGEIPALLIVDAVSRLLPGVLGHEASAAEETFSGGLLEYPQYTRPEDFRSMKVPDVLLSGNHREIGRWRRAQSVIRTYRRRPELLERAELDDEDRRLIEGLKNGL